MKLPPHYFPATPAAPPDDSQPAAIEISARSSPESALPPSAQTHSRCTGAARHRTENKRTSAIVSINRFPSAPAGILAARRTIAGLDAPPIAPWPRPFPLSLDSPQFHGPRRPGAPFPTLPDTAAAIP